MKKILTYGRQFLDTKDNNLVKEALKSNLLSSGPYLNKFEDKIKKMTKVKFSIVCNSGTSAIHLAFMGLGIKHGDNVLMPVVNFISAYNMCKLIGANPIFLDVDQHTGQITPEIVEQFFIKNKKLKIKLLVTMYLGGYPENIIEFFKLKKKYNFLILEDSCHAFGASYYHNKKYHKIGSCKHSDISTFSFHPVKTITTGEGGATTTNNKYYYKKMKLLRSHGIIRKKKYWQYDLKYSGYNYRISDLNCSLGISQIDKTNYFINERSKIYKNYLKLFKNFKSDIVCFPKYSNKITPSYHLFLININFRKLKINKNQFIKMLNKKNIYPQYHYIPLNKFSLIKEKKIYQNSEKYFSNTLSIPIYVGLKKKDQIYIFNNITNIIKKNVK